MRCPKCGYNSFDHLDSCKKCGKDLVEHKQKFGIVSVLFPGQMKPADKAAAEDESVVDDVVAVATATATTAGAAGVADVAADSAPAEAGDGDDFGFDFMGDSEEEEDLSFDELFEEAPADEDVEETLPSPEQAADAGDAGDDFSFDAEEEPAADDVALEADFGFDPNAEGSEDEDSLAADDFERPPAEKDDFSFDSDNVEFEDSEEEDTGTKGDPQSPFDSPESSLLEEAPEETFNLFVAEPELGSVVSDDDPLLTDPLAEEDVDQNSEETLVDSFFAAELDASGDAEKCSPAATEPFEKPIVETADIGIAAASPFDAGLDEEVGETGAALLPTTRNRVAAFCCDLLLLFVVGTSFVIAAEAAISSSGDSLLPSMETLIDLSVPYFLVLFSLAFGYFTLFHFLAGQTPGKMLAGLRVETIAGEPLLFSQAFLRSVGGLLQVLPVGLGYLAILSSPEKRGWNDQLAGTRLISLKGLSEEV